VYDGTTFILAKFYLIKILLIAFAYPSVNSYRFDKEFAVKTRIIPATCTISSDNRSSDNFNSSNLSLRNFILVCRLYPLPMISHFNNGNSCSRKVDLIDRIKSIIFQLLEIPCSYRFKYRKI
jgi:hypothetical protein